MNEDKEWPIILIFLGILTVIFLGTLRFLADQGWMENPKEFIPVPSPVVKERVEYVASPYPTPVVRRVTETVTMSPEPDKVTATETVRVTVPGQGMSEACIEAIWAADAMRKAIEQGGDVDTAAYAYRLYREYCKI